jgi:hypothetical protein
MSVLHGSHCTYVRTMPYSRTRITHHATYGIQYVLCRIRVHASRITRHTEYSTCVRTSPLPQSKFNSNPYRMQNSNFRGWVAPGIDDTICNVMSVRGHPQTKWLYCIRVQASRITRRMEYSTYRYSLPRDTGTAYNQPPAASCIQYQPYPINFFSMSLLGVTLFLGIVIVFF